MRNSDLPKAILRISLAIVFLFFGFWQISSPDNWAGLIPSSLTGVILTANNWVVFNGILEITLGTFLILGLYVRFSAMILALHLFGITFSMGLNPIGIRDFGLSFATLVIFLNGPDKYCLDDRFNKTQK